MPLTPRSLDYEAGFAGAPFSPDQVAPACPNWENARLTLEGSRIQPFPGYRRTLLDDLWDEVRQDELRIIQTTPKAGGRDDGSMVVVLDGTNGRILSLGHFTGGTPFPETNGIPASPVELGTMLRHSNHDYVSLVALRGKMILNHPFAEQQVWDGDTFRISGISEPKLPPRVTVASGTIVERDDGATLWTSSQAGLVTMTSVNTAPAFSGNYNNASITSGVAVGNLAFRDVGGTISANVTRVRLALRNDHPTEAIPRLKLNIIFADAVTLGGTTIVIPVDVELPPLTWTQVDLLLPTSATLPFAFLSVGVALASTFEEDLFNQSGGLLNLRWDSLETSEPTTGSLSGNWLVGFTWYDSTRDRESTMSLLSNLVQLGGSEGMRIDLAGGYPGIDGGEFSISSVSDPAPANTGDGTVTNVLAAADQPTQTWTLTALGGGPTASFSVVGSVSGAQANATSATAYENDFVSFLIGDGAAAYIVGDDFAFTVTGGVFAANSNPDTANVDKIRLYLSKTVWGTDEFGSPIFRRALEEDIPFANATGEILVTFVDQKDENQLVSSPPFSFLAKGKPPSTTFSLADKQRILHFGQPDYTVGEVGVTNNSHLVTLVAGVSTASPAVPDSTNTGDGGVSLVAPTAAALSEILTITATGAGPAATFTVVGDISGAFANATSGTPYSNAVIAFTIEDGGTAYASGDSFVIITTAAADNTPQFSPWAEGRQIRVGSDDELYTVVKVLDTNDDGTFNALWIGRGFNFNEPYQGSTDTDTAYVIQGHKNRVWYTGRTSARGADVESVNILGFFDVDMPGDEITGGGHLGRQVVICGRNHVYIMTQNTVARDDLISSPAVFARPSLVNGAPGCIAGRTFIQLPGGKAMWLGPNGKLVLATLQGIGYHPLADRLKGWMTDSGRVAQERLQFSHAFYDTTLGWYTLLLQESLSSAGISDQVQEASTNRDPPVDFEAVNTTNGYDFPWPWTDGIDAITFWSLIAVPMVEFAPFAPRIGPADMTATPSAAIDSTDGITGGFIRNEPWNSSNDGGTGLLAPGNVNNNRVMGGWVLNAPTPLNEQTGDNSVAPANVWHTRYAFQRPENGYYHFRFSSTNMPIVAAPPVIATNAFAGWHIFQDTFSNELDMFLDVEEGIRLFFYVYFDAPEDRVIPPGTFTIRLKLDDAFFFSESGNDRDIAIDQPIRGGKWNLIELTAPAFNAANGYTDVNAVSKDVVQYDSAHFFLTQAVDASVFDDNNQLNLYFTGGKQVKATSDITVTRPTAGSEAAFSDPCSSFGDTRESGPILVDFRRIAVVDEVTAAAYIGNGYALSTTSGVSSSCSAADVNPHQIIGGAIDGYVNKVFSPDAYGLGTPMQQTFWTVIGGGSNYVLVNTVGGGMVGGAAPLEELACRLIHPDGTVEDRIVAESGTDYVQVTENWTTTPTTGTLIIGPLDWFIQPAEKRFLFEAAPSSLTMNVDYDTPLVPRIDITVFGPARQDEVFADEAATLVSRLRVSLADIRIGEGKIGLPSVAAKAMMYRIGGIAQDRGVSRFGPIEVEEQTYGGEV